MNDKIKNKTLFKSITSASTAGVIEHYKKAFTLAEALIVLGIISVLATLSIIAIRNSKPDESVTMFRKAYKTTLSIVQDMYIDKNIYENANEPIDTLRPNAPTIIAYTKGFTTNTTANYFADKFIEKLNPIQDLSTTSTKAVVTADGIYWVIKDNFSNYSSTNKDPRTFITVYTDGQETSSSACSYSTTCPTPNKFVFNINKTGQVTPVQGTTTTNAKKIDQMACSLLRYPKVLRYSKIPTDKDVNPCFGYTSNLY